MVRDHGAFQLNMANKKSPGCFVRSKVIFCRIGISYN